MSLMFTEEIRVSSNVFVLLMVANLSIVLLSVVLAASLMHHTTAPKIVAACALVALASLAGRYILRNRLTKSFLTFVDHYGGPHQNYEAQKAHADWLHVRKWHKKVLVGGSAATVILLCGLFLSCVFLSWISFATAAAVIDVVLIMMVVWTQRGWQHHKRLSTVVSNIYARRIKSNLIFCDLSMR